ncbi:MAG TPA: ScpA family protein, partial [Arenimonas sp.]
YERYKKAAEDIDQLDRLDRDTALASVHVPDRSAVKAPPPVDLNEMLLALRDVLKRADLYTHHAIRREALSVRQRMGEVLSRLSDRQFHGFETLFTVEEGRLGVVVTFLSILELAKEQLLEIVQEAPLAPIYVKSLAAGDDDVETALPDPTSDDTGAEAPND